LNSDYVILIAIVGVFSGIAIYEGYAINPAFYSQAVIIWIMFGYFLLADRRPID
jgi:hypothetical protein